MDYLKDLNSFIPFSFQNIFLFFWGSFFTLRGWDQVFNFQYFYGTDRTVLYHDRFVNLKINTALGTVLMWFVSFFLFIN